VARPFESHGVDDHPQLATLVKAPCGK